MHLYGVSNEPHQRSRRLCRKTLWSSRFVIPAEAESTPPLLDVRFRGHDGCYTHLSSELSQRGLRPQPNGFRSGGFQTASGFARNPRRRLSASILTFPRCRKPALSPVEGWQQGKGPVASGHARSPRRAWVRDTRDSHPATRTGPLLCAITSARRRDRVEARKPVLQGRGDTVSKMFAPRNDAPIS